MSSEVATGIDLDQPALTELIGILKASNGIPVIPFVGAGLAAPYGLPGWSEFLLTFARKAKCVTTVKKILASSQEDRFELAAEQIDHRYPAGLQNAIQTVLQRTLPPSTYEEESAMRELTKFGDGAIITTNFDNVLEEVFARSGIVLNDVHLGGLANVDDLPQFPRRRELLKLHGCAGQHRSMVLTSSQYAHHYCHQNGELDLAKPLPAILAHCAASSVLLFLGCSLQQDRYLKLVALHGRKGDVTHFAILSKPEADQEELARTDELLCNYNIRPIWFEQGRYDQIRLLLRHIHSPEEPIGDSEQIVNFEINVPAPNSNQSIMLGPYLETLFSNNEALAKTNLGKLVLGRLTLFNQDDQNLEIKAFPYFSGPGDASKERLVLEPTDDQYFFMPQGPSGVRIQFEPRTSHFRLIDTGSNNQIIVRISNA